MSKRHRDAPTFWQLFVFLSFSRCLPFISKLYSLQRTLLSLLEGYSLEEGVHSRETWVKYMYIFPVMGPLGTSPPPHQIKHNWGTWHKSCWRSPEFANKEVKTHLAPHDKGWMGWGGERTGTEVSALSPEEAVLRLSEILTSWQLQQAGTSCCYFFLWHCPAWRNPPFKGNRRSSISRGCPSEKWTPWKLFLDALWKSHRKV